MLLLAEYNSFPATSDNLRHHDRHLRQYDPRQKTRDFDEPTSHHCWFRVSAVGAVTGLVGAGGGFLIVPALVLFGGLPMHLAIGTSLLTIVMKNAAALGGHIVSVSINWPVTMVFTAIAIVGSLIGARWVSKIQPDNLRVGFGWFVLIMGIAVISTELAPAFF